MRASRMNIVTLRETPADAEIVSHQLLIRSGFIYKSGSGLYIYGPMMQRVLNKVRAIVTQEITTAGGMEITMPIMQEQGLWESSGRWEEYQATRTMLTVTDRGGQTFGLAPTAEEVVTDYAGHLINSHKQLPVCYFQQHTKFRDEIRPRFGLMRVKEFVMMDAYSFHASDESLSETYEEMRQAYHRIFERCGLQALEVEADSGSIGGSGSHEFMIAADSGEDTILFNRDSAYAANVERAVGVISAAAAWTWSSDLVEVETPDQGGIADVVTFLGEKGYAGIAADRMLKTVLFTAESTEGTHTVAACVRGDRDVNDVKLSNAIGRQLPEGVTVLGLESMNEATVRQVTGAEPGFAGPLASLAVDICIADETLEEIGPLVTGGNKTDMHIAGFDLQRDGRDGIIFEDILTYQAGDACPRGGGELSERRGIEAGHIFKLGTKYSAAMGATFTNESNKQQPLTMGCYGIGSSRVLAAAVEQYHDDNGMQWPMNIAPYHCVVVAARKDDEGKQVAEDIYKELLASGVEVILDERKLGPGVKFKDWDLMGIPLRLVIGRGWDNGTVECKARVDGTPQDLSRDEAIAWVQAACK